MKRLFHPLLHLLARSTNNQLAQQVEFLKAENALLRKRLPKRVCLTTEEKRLLVRLGQAIGSGVRALISIVSYPTYRRYVNQITPPPPHPQAGTRRKPGRPRTADQVQELVLMLARENVGLSCCLGTSQRCCTGRSCSHSGRTHHPQASPSAAWKQRIVAKTR